MGIAENFMRKMQIFRCGKLWITSSLFDLSTEKTAKNGGWGIKIYLLSPVFSTYPQEILRFSPMIYSGN